MLTVVNGEATAAAPPIKQRSSTQGSKLALNGELNGEDP
jgi:hypothetical protein